MSKFDELRSIRKKYINIQDIMYNTSPELIFQEFLGHYPDLRKRYLSPFRDDKNPGCRFERKRGQLYFVDNAGYKGKLYFNCFSFVQYLYNVDFREALQVIADRMNIKSGRNRKTNIITNKSEVSKKEYFPIIKFKYKRWRSPHYFTNFDIPSHYLNKQPYYNVVTYWANSKIDTTVRKNKYGHYNNMIAYHFEDTGHSKLYFPDQKFRFFSNCNNDDIFGWHRMENYLSGNKKELLVTKSAKDELVANFHFGINSLALQQEVFTTVPKKLLTVIKEFDTIYIWFDPDETGIKGALKLKQILSKYHNKIITILHDVRYGKDISNIYRNGYSIYRILKKQKNEI